MRVMIVDDSKAMRLIIKRALRKAGFGGHTFEEADDGDVALAKIRASTPDLVLSDWNMPTMSGLDLLEALGSANLVVPFGFITSEGTDTMRQRARDAGARFLISKPFTVEAMQRALASYLG